MSKRRDAFLVNQSGSSLFWGWDAGVQPHTAERALADRRILCSPRRKTTIYRLVPVTLAEVERQAAREKKARARKGKRKGGQRRDE